MIWARQEEKGTTKDEMAGWHHWLDGSDSEWTRSWWWTGRPGMLWFMGSQRVGHDWATELNWTELKSEQQLKTHLDVWLTEGDAVCVRLHWSFPLACVTFPYKFLLTFVILPLLCRGRGRFPSVLLLQSKIPGVDGWEDKEFAFNAGVLGLIPGLGRSPGDRNGSLLPYSRLENPMDGGAWLGYSPWNFPDQNTVVGRQTFPSPGYLPNPGIKPRSPALQADSLPAEYTHVHVITYVYF